MKHTLAVLFYSFYLWSTIQASSWAAPAEFGFLLNIIQLEIASAVPVRLLATGCIDCNYDQLVRYLTNTEKNPKDQKYPNENFFPAADVRWQERPTAQAIVNNLRAAYAGRKYGFNPKVNYAHVSSLFTGSKALPERWGDVFLAAATASDRVDSFLLDDTDAMKFHRIQATQSINWVYEHRIADISDGQITAFNTDHASDKWTAASVSKTTGDGLRTYQQFDTLATLKQNNIIPFSEEAKRIADWAETYSATNGGAIRHQRLLNALQANLAGFRGCP